MVLAGLLLAALLAVFMAFAGAARWTLATESGARWLVNRLPGVEATGLQGSLLDGQLRAQRLRIVWDGGQASLTLDGLSADQLRWRFRPTEAPGTWVALELDRLAADRVTYIGGPPGARPLPLPSSLTLPLQLKLQLAEVALLQIEQLAPATALRATDLVLDNRPGAAHSVQSLQGQWQGLAVQGSAQIDHAPPFATTAQAALHPVAGGDSPAWGALLRAAGPLESLVVQATLRGVPLADKPAPSLDLRGLLQPMQAWPVGELDLQTSALDLSALHAAAPQTRLNATVRVLSRALDQPISAELRLSNAQPGRWNEGRLPLSRLSLGLAGRIDQIEGVEATSFEMELADALRPAGRVSGQARWQGHALALQTQLIDVAPQALDSRAPAMKLSGPLALTLSGLPSPNPTAQTPTPPWQAQLRTTLNGRLDAAPQAVMLKIEAEANANRIEIKQAQAETGSASAQAQARLVRQQASSPWQLFTQGALRDFDLLPWLPWLAGGSGVQAEAWRRGPHQLSGQWQFDLRLPARAETLSPLALAQRVAGNGSLKLTDSVLAGLPLQADATLAYANNQGTLKAALRLAGNVVTLEGSGDPAGSGQTDHWHAEIQAEQLAALAPLARLVPALSPFAPSQGSAQLTFNGSGRWPAGVRTQGRAQVKDLKAGSLALQRGQFDWTLDTGPNQPLALTLDVTGLQQGSQRAEHLRGTVRGQLAAHRIDIEAVLPMLPPPAAITLLGLSMPTSTAARSYRAGSRTGSSTGSSAGSRTGSSTGRGTRALLLAQGGWVPEAAGGGGGGGGGGGRWRTDIERLAVGAWDGQALPPVPAGSASGPLPAPAALAGPAWVEGSNLRAELRFDAQGAVTALRADAGSIRLADTTRLRWDEVLVDLQTPAAQISLQAEIEPFAVAPLLARLQPEMGWTGDLKLGARVQLQAADRFDADILIERSSGDLAAGGQAQTSPVSSSSPAPGTITGPQAMGLNELRLALRARDGLWSFQGDMAGALLGQLRGRVQARTSAQARWPGTDAPVNGKLQLNVANIGIWNAWVPAGWRLSGQLQGTAEVGGSFSAPRYTGELTGSKLALRNLLQGVNVSEGDMTVRLTGDKAEIERFALRGGEGTLTVSGDAVFGASPRVQLKLQAERFRVLGRVDRQLIASGQARAAFDKEGIELAGKIAVDEGLFDVSHSQAPTLDEDVNVRQPGVPVVEDSDIAARPRMKLALDLELDMGNQMRLRGYGLDTGLRGQLKVSNPGGRLAFNGSIRTADGTFAGYGQKLTVQRGIVAFSGPLDTARVDVLALRPNLDIRVGVTATGPPGNLRIRLFSDPEMSENAKLSWLLLGREPDSLGRADTALLQRAAVALLSGEGEAPTDALLRNLGIDEVSLRQSDGETRETIITVGKQLSQRWYLGYERGVNATTGTWQLIYRIAQRFTLRAQSGLENSLDLIWIWRVGEATQRPETPDGVDAVRKSVMTPP